MRNNRTNSCQICFNPRTNRLYHHHHISTRYLQQLRDRSHPYDTPGICIVCRSIHRGIRPNRNRLLLTSSTLYECWKDPTFQPTSCFDVESIIGGTYEDGKRAFLRSFSDDPRPVDILVVMGINNISRKQTLTEILNEIHNLLWVVKNHSEEHNHTIPNRICFATCIQPPKFVAFDYRHLPSHIKTNGNHHFRIWKLNKEIININRYNNITNFRLHNEGTFLYRGRRYHKGFFWREDTWSRKLHFTPQVKAEIGMRVAGFFDSLNY